MDEFKSIIEFHSGNNHNAAQDSDSPVVEEEDVVRPPGAARDVEGNGSTAGDEAV